jgi:predicted Zn-dependent protease
LEDPYDSYNYGTDDYSEWNDGGYIYDTSYDDGSDPFDGDGFASGASNANTPGTDVIAAYDSAQGDTQAAASADAAFQQAALSAAGDLATSPASLAADPSDPEWASSTITWSFAPGPTTGATPVSAAIAQKEQAVVERAMQTWAQASGLNLQEVADTGNADLMIGWGDLDTATSNMLGFTSVPQTDGVLQAGGVVLLEDPGETALTTNAEGQLMYAGTDATFYQVALHEIGHALGLGDDSDPNSVMYYALGADNTTLDATDLAAIHQLYGTASASASASLDPTQASTEVSLLTAAALSANPLAAHHQLVLA